METLALTDSERVEIISMFASAASNIPAVATAPGWYVIGAMPIRIASIVRLSMIGSVSDAGLVQSARLYCITPGAVGPVVGSDVSTSALVDEEQFSGKFELPPGLYWVQVQVVGNAGVGSGDAQRVAPETT